MAIIISSLEDDKAIDITSVNLSGKTSIADYMVVASGTSRRHVNSVADHAQRKLKEKGYGYVSVEGMKECDWVLIDAGDVIVHLFQPQVRNFYGIEKMWLADMSTIEDNIIV